MGDDDDDDDVDMLYAGCYVVGMEINATVFCIFFVGIKRNKKTNIEQEQKPKITYKRMAIKRYVLYGEL